MANLLTRLVQKDGLGLQSQILVKEVSPFMSDLLFGIDVNNPKSSLNFKGIMLQKTTTKDGKTLEWRLISTPDKTSTLTAAATAGDTTITVADGSLFSVADDIQIWTGSTAERKLIVSVAGNVLTLDSALANNQSSGDTVKVVTHAKGKWTVSNKVQGAWSDETASNYFQTFDATLTIDTDVLNSHILATAGGMNKTMKQALDSKAVDAGINEYLKMEFVRIFGYDILQDVERAFWAGTKKEVTIGWTTYRYTGGFEEFKTEDITKDVATDFSSEKEFFDYVAKKIYDVENESAKVKANNVILVCNNAFYRKFLTLQPTTIQHTEAQSQEGYKLTKIFLNSKVYEVHYSPALDQLVDDPATDGLLYIFPKDAVAAKTTTFNSIDVTSGGITPVSGNGTDVKIVADPNNEANGDVFNFYFYFKLWFVFGAYVPSGAVNVYRKYKFANCV